MSLLDIFLIAVGLSMDACAVSLTQGIRLRPFSWKKALFIAGLFGAFQAIMPLLGWVLGTQFEQYVASAAPWIAFGLLALLGANMLREAFSTSSDESEKPQDRSRTMELLALAVATSIDALAVGVSFGVLKVAILSAVIIIGVTTFVLSFISVGLGQRLGEKLGKPAEIFGGIVLIIMGLRILLEHFAII